MSTNFEEIFNSYDRITKVNIVEDIITFIQRKYNICIEFKDLKDETFMKSYSFKLLPLETKQKILLDLVKYQFSFSHILQNYIKNLIDAKDRYNDDKWYEYDKKELLNTGLISEIEFSNKGIIKTKGLSGNFTFFSLFNLSIRNNIDAKISPMSDFQAMCFTNAIDMLELNKSGKILVIQIDSSTKTYLHTVYMNNQIIYDLNYYLAYPLQQLPYLYNYKLMNEIDYNLWQEMKNKFTHIKPESLVVASSILNNPCDIESMIDYLDENKNFQSRRK